MYHILQYKPEEEAHLIQGHESHGRQQCTEMVPTYKPCKPCVHIQHQDGVTNFNINFVNTNLMVAMNTKMFLTSQTIFFIFLFLFYILIYLANHVFGL